MLPSASGKEVVRMHNKRSAGYKPSTSHNVEVTTS
jgi:hypothetical protein